LGVTGSIAAYKAPQLLRELIRSGADVTPVVTQDATRFVGLLTFEALAGKRLSADLWSGPEPLVHTVLGKSADGVVIAPATASIIAKIAGGIADDLLSAVVLSTKAPTLVVPAMHSEMWENAATRHNVEVLRSRGITVMEPSRGDLAGFDEGPGRMPEIPDIVSLLELVVETALSGRSRLGATTPDKEFDGLSVVVTAGGTREPIDAVRYIGNRSSGKMGNAIAREAWLRGAQVRLITTMPSGQMRNGIEEIVVETAEEMHTAVVDSSSAADILVMAAAVADFRPKRPEEKKIKKETGLESVVVEPTPDVLEEVASLRRSGGLKIRIVVGFAAETDELEANARAKLAKKNLDAIVANDVTKEGSGFGSDTNEAVIFFADGSSERLPLMRKELLARVLWDRLAERYLAG
jgi:phosphopantothenoylcysteine decarboxylase/phosphopantothenate--cysteine ligase